jgi:hypothetical protein
MITPENLDTEFDKKRQKNDKSNLGDGQEEKKEK